MFYDAKKTNKIWYVNIDNIVISKLVETKTNSKYLTGYFYKVLRPLVSTFPKMYRCVKTFKVKDGDKDKSNKLMSFYIYDEKLSKNKQKKTFGLKLKT